jgi:hypothetical protein
MINLIYNIYNFLPGIRAGIGHGVSLEAQAALSEIRKKSMHKCGRAYSEHTDTHTSSLIYQL